VRGLGEKLGASFSMCTYVCMYVCMYVLYRASSRCSFLPTGMMYQKKKKRNQAPAKNNK
jgi:hypothetical protein